MLSLRIQVNDPQVEEIIRAVEHIASDREQQAYLLEAACRWVQMVAFPDHGRMQSRTGVQTDLIVDTSLPVPAPPAEQQ